MTAIARHRAATRHDAHGELVVHVVAHHGGSRLAAPVYTDAPHARLLLTRYFDATATMVDPLLADAYAQRHADALGRHASDEPPAR